MEKNIFELFGVLKSKEKIEMLKDMSKNQRNLFYELEQNEEKAKEYRLNDLLYDFDKDFVERILELEINEYLKDNSSNNRKNGYTSNISLNVGGRIINFNRPRLRNEKGFDSEIIPKRRRFMNDISDDIITLFCKNNSVNDIKEIIKRMFGIKISTAKISKICQTISEEVLEWRNRELEKCYFTLNIDCTYITVRDNKNLISHKIPIYIAVGTRLDGHKEIVGMYLGNEDEFKNVIDEMYDKDIGESKKYWITVFNDLKDRGVERILFIISDGLCGLEDAIKDEFPLSVYQRCIVHLSRNVKKVVTIKDAKEILTDFKKLYTSTTKEESNIEYNNFMDKYNKKKTLVKKVAEYYKYIECLYDVPENIRKYIYTNNIVESANSKIKRGFYGRGALPNVESAINIIYVNLKDLEIKWKKKKINNWENIFNELDIVYKEEIEKYL